MDNFQPAIGLKSRHLQTLYSTLFRSCPIDKFDIETFTLTDGDFVDCYWYQKPNESSCKPIVTLFHGLAGSYRSPYIQGMMLYLHNAGYCVVLMHFRGCSGKPNHTARAYHSGDTADAKAWIDYLQQQYSNAQLFAIGYSLGGNMLLKLLGNEYIHNSPLCAAASVSAPLKLAICAKTIQIGFAKIYQKYLLLPLKQSLLDKFSRYDYQKLIGLSKKQVEKITSIEEFDDLYTARIHGFSGAKDYYTKASSEQYLKNISIPTMIIHSLDDPFMTPSILPKPHNLPNNLSLQISNYGGHLGFIAGHIFKPSYWLEQRIGEYFDGFIKTKNNAENLRVTS